MPHHPAGTFPHRAPAEATFTRLASPAPVRVLHLGETHLEVLLRSSWYKLRREARGT
jgi:hypothetical protein